MNGLNQARCAGTAIWMIVVGLLLLPQHAEALPREQVKLPEPLGYVSDHAGVVEADWKAHIRSVCQDLERKTGVEMVVVTVKDTAPYATANEYASALYQRWGIGTAQQDHGVLVLAVVGTRQAAITVGRSLLAVITPPVAEEVGSKYLQPSFKNEQFGEGLYRAAVVLASAAQEVREESQPRPRAKWLGFLLATMTGVGALAFLWWISRPDLRHPFGRIRRGEFWGSGQGGFGGNFGGFGGGASGEGLR